MCAPIVWHAGRLSVKELERDHQHDTIELTDNIEKRNQRKFVIESTSKL